MSIQMFETVSNTGQLNNVEIFAYFKLKKKNQNKQIFIFGYTIWVNIFLLNK